jgi:hypothetical protein
MHEERMRYTAAVNRTYITAHKSKVNWAHTSGLLEHMHTRVLECHATLPKMQMVTAALPCRSNTSPNNSE